MEVMSMWNLLEKLLLKRIVSGVLISFLLAGAVTLTASSTIEIVSMVNTVATGQLSSERHFLAIRSDNSLWAWGNNSHGQLGDGTTSDRTSSNPVMVMDNVRFVAAEQGFSMAITNDGVLWAWGSNTHGRLGDGTVVNRHTPVRIMDNVTYVTLGRNYAFAIRGDGGLYSWGNNVMGSLGDSSPAFVGDNRHSPFRIMDNVINVGTGINVVNWAVQRDNSLWVWGGMFDSTIQTFANVRTSSTPTRIADSNVVAMEMIIMGRSLLILMSDGNLFGIGSNNRGQLGDGTGIDTNGLVGIMTDVVSVKTFSDTVFAIRNDNSLWGWGDHHRLRHINGDLVSSGVAYNPVKLMANVSSVVYSGSFSTYILKTDGALWEYRSFGEPILLKSGISTAFSNTLIPIQPQVPAPPVAPVPQHEFPSGIPAPLPEFPFIPPQPVLLHLTEPLLRFQHH